MSETVYKELYEANKKLEFMQNTIMAIAGSTFPTHYHQPLAVLNNQAPSQLIDIFHTIDSHIFFNLIYFLLKEIWIL